MRFSNQRFRDHSKSSALRYLDEFDSVSSAFLALDHRQSGRLAGTATAFVSVEHGTVDIGVLVGVQFSGQGLAKEALSAIVDSLLDQGFRKITIGTSAGNVPMLRVIDALGFEPDGVRVKQELIDGWETDVVYFALFSSPRNL